MVQEGMVTQTCWQSVKLRVIKVDEQGFLSRLVTFFFCKCTRNKNLEIALVSVNLGPETSHFLLGGISCSTSLLSE